MEINYNNDLNGSYLIVTDIDLEQIDEFALKMMTKNHIPGILPVKWEYLNGKGNIRNDISSRKSLKKSGELHSLQQRDVASLVESIIQCAAELEEYFMDIKSVFLKPDMIFTDRTGSGFSFCFNPVKNVDNHDELRKLFEYLTGVIDYDDPELVNMVFEMSMIVQNDNCSLKELKECLIKFECGNRAKARRLFNDNKETEAEAAGIEGAEAGLIREDMGENPIDLLFDESEPVDNSNPGFGEKLKIYLKEKSLKQIIADIDDGVLINEIKRSKRPVSISPGKHDDYPRLMGKGNQKGVHIDIKKSALSIGAYGGKADRGIKGKTVSGMHARLYRNEKNGTGCYVEDLGSTNGTFVNGRRIRAHKKCEVKSGDTITFADQDFIMI